MKLIIIDYGSGNIKSVFNSIKFVLDNNDIKCDIKVSNLTSDINFCNFIVLPGVGAFKNCKTNILKHKGLLETLCENVIIKEKPFLGICIGMQLLATFGYESGKASGFDWIKGEVKPLKNKNEMLEKKLKIPHVGWNNIKLLYKDRLLKDITENDQFYFVHSFYYDVHNNENLLAYVDYGFPVPAVIKKKNIYGVQFHPEKSGFSGEKILNNCIKNFIR